MAVISEKLLWHTQVSWRSNKDQFPLKGKLDLSLLRRCKNLRKGSRILKAILGWLPSCIVLYFQPDVWSRGPTTKVRVLLNVMIPGATTPQTIKIRFDRYLLAKSKELHQKRYFLFRKHVHLYIKVKNNVYVLLRKVFLIETTFVLTEKLQNVPIGKASTRHAR